MKALARRFVLRILTALARRRLSPKTEIIGITGSVGKTTAKDATVWILRTKFRVCASRDSFNSEFGVPLTLLGERSGFSNPVAWLGILLRAVGKSFTKLRCEKIVLELGVDAPGDMQRLLTVVQPTTGVFLNVQPVHLDAGQFNSVAEIAAEKSLLISSLPTDGIAILNADDPFAAKLKPRSDRLTFGLRENADLRATAVRETAAGLQATISFRKQTGELVVPILGQHNLSSLLAAIAIGFAHGIDLQKCLSALADFQLPPGRLNLLAGIRDTKIIDSSYNSNPASAAAALHTLRDYQTSGRKIAVLGQMNELGEDSAKLHHEIGVSAAAIADEVIGVFGEARTFVKLAQQAGKPARFCETAAAAGEYLQSRLRAGDLVLVKGSQNKVRLEKCVAQILAPTVSAAEVLCRQGKHW